MVTKPSIEDIKMYIVDELDSARKDKEYINPFVVADNVFYLLSKEHNIVPKENKNESN